MDLKSVRCSRNQIWSSDSDAQPKKNALRLVEQKDNDRSTSPKIIGTNVWWSSILSKMGPMRQSEKLAFPGRLRELQRLRRLCGIWTNMLYFLWTRLCVGWNLLRTGNLGRVTPGDIDCRYPRDLVWVLFWNRESRLNGSGCSYLRLWMTGSSCRNHTAIRVSEQILPRLVWVRTFRNGNILSWDPNAVSRLQWEGKESVLWGGKEYCHIGVET